MILILVKDDLSSGATDSVNMITFNNYNRL